MSECDRYERLISEYVDGELQEPEKTELESHLRKCTHCRRVCDAFRAISLSLGEEAAPAGLTEGVMAAVRTQGEPGAGSAKRPGKSWPKYLALAACLMLAVLSAVRLSSPRVPATSQPAPQPAQFGMAGVTGEIDPRDAVSEDTDGAEPDAGLEAGPNEAMPQDTAEDAVSGNDSGGKAEAPEAVRLVRVSGAVEAELTDTESISEVMDIISSVSETAEPAGEVSYRLDLEYDAGGSATVVIWAQDGELVCSDGGSVYSAAGSEAELLDVIS